MSAGKVVLGALAGIAIGAIAGILLAPEKGSKTRRQIMEKGDDYVDDLKSRFDEFFDTLMEKFESSKGDAERLVEKGKGKFDGAKREFKNGAADFKNAEM